MSHSRPAVSPATRTPGSWARALAACGATVFLALPLVGCGTSGVMTVANLENILASRGVNPEDVVMPHRLTPAMEDWAHAVAPSELHPRDRLERLRDTLLDPERMAVAYSWGYTGTAIEVFEQRQANCLAFTNLFLAMAREVGVPVYFMAVENVETFRKRGDLVVVSDHIAVGYGETTGRQIFDFSEDPIDDPRFVRKISDLEAVAMFHSNRGAEALQQGYLDESIEWLRTAVAVEPNLATAWVNLGVALRRAGDESGAEIAYKRALERDTRIHSAYQNLASLLRTQGRDDEAVAYEETLASVPTNNPYTYLALGDISLRNGRVDDAERFYRRAVHLSDDDPEPFAALGELALAEGDERQARKMLRRAQKTGQPNARVELLASRLGGDNRI